MSPPTSWERPTDADVQWKMNQTKQRAHTFSYSNTCVEGLKALAHVFCDPTHHK